jgi:hypothetical protein
VADNPASKVHGRRVVAGWLGSKITRGKKRRTSDAIPITIVPRIRIIESFRSYHYLYRLSVFRNPRRSGPRETLRCPQSGGKEEGARQYCYAGTNSISRFLSNNWRSLCRPSFGNGFPGGREQAKATIPLCGTACSCGTSGLLAKRTACGRMAADRMAHVSTLLDVSKGDLHVRIPCGPGSLIQSPRERGPLNCGLVGFLSDFRLTRRMAGASFGFSREGPSKREIDRTRFSVGLIP